jgi:hypothetical protein
MDTTVFSFTLRKNAKRAAEAIYPALDNFRLSPGKKDLLHFRAYDRSDLS